MRKLGIVFACFAVALAALPAAAINPGTEIFVPAAARGGGAGGSTWITDLYVYNPGMDQVTVDIYWLDRGTDNSGATAQSYTVNGGETMVLADVILNVFGESSAGGAFRIVSTGDVMVNSRIYNQMGDDTFGQGFEGIPAEAAITAAKGATTDFVGLTDNASFRTNLFAVNTAATTSNVTFNLMDTSGTVMASRSYQMPPYSALYKEVSDLGGPSFDQGTIHAEVTQGSAIVVGSKIDSGSGDPTTLEPWWACGDGGGNGGTELTTAAVYYGVLDDGAGYYGGFIMQVNDNAEVTSVEFTFPSAHPTCNYFFGGGGTFETPVPLADFEGGVQFTNTYSGADNGDMLWTVTLQEQDPKLLFAGTMNGQGSGWGGGAITCNNMLPDDTLILGKEQITK